MHALRNTALYGLALAYVLQALPMRIINIVCVVKFICNNINIAYFFADQKNFRNCRRHPTCPAYLQKSRPNTVDPTRRPVNLEQLLALCFVCLSNCMYLKALVIVIDKISRAESNTYFVLLAYTVSLIITPLLYTTVTFVVRFLLTNVKIFGKNVLNN